jgi:hypothetical protein
MLPLLALSVCGNAKFVETRGRKHKKVKLLLWKRQEYYFLTGVAKPKGHTNKLNSIC